MTQQNEQIAASSKVMLIRPDVSFSEGKQTFLDYIAQRYDQFTADHPDNPPSLLLFGISNNNGVVSSGYISLSGDSNEERSRDAMIVSRTHDVIGWEMQDWEGWYGDAHD